MFVLSSSGDGEIKGGKIIKKLSTFFIFLQIVIPLLFTISFLPQVTSGEQASPNLKLPDVTIKLLQEIRTAHVGPEDSCEVVFNGTVNVKCEEGSGVLVFLNGVSTWGKVEYAPENIHFSKSGNKPFMVRVFVRPRESTKNYGRVTITGRWEMPYQELSGSAYPTEGAQGRINIAQFHRFTLMSRDAFKEIYPDDESIFNLTIQNRGNGLDEFSIRIKNLEELKDKGFDILLDHTGVVILENPKKAFIEFWVRTPSDFESLDYHSIKVEVNSINGIEKGVEPQTFTFVIRIPVKSFYLTPEFSMCSIIMIMLFCLIIFCAWCRSKIKVRRK